MAFNGSGVFQRVYNWVTDANAGVPITASRVDTEDDGFATGLSNVICKDGQTTITANLPMSGFRHTGVGDGVLANDYATMGQAQTNIMEYVVTTGSANAYVAAPTPAISAYATGQSFKIKANFANTGACTIAVSGLAAKSIKLSTGADPAANVIVSGGLYDISYDGTNFILLDTENVTRTKDSNYADFTLQRPILKDYGELKTSPSSSSGTLTLDITNGNHFTVTLTENVSTLTISNPTATGNICAVELWLKQDGTGGWTFAWPSSVKWPAASAPTVTAAASKTDIYVLQTKDGGTTWAGSTVGQNYTGL